MNNDLISRRAAIKAVTGWDSEPTDEDIEYVLNELTVVDAEPVRHGYWKSRSNFLECSECGREFTQYDWEGSVISYYYCPHCGVKMCVEVIND